MAAYASRISLRRIFTFSPFHSSLKEPFRPSIHEEKAGSPEIWKKIFCFVCLPSLALATVNVLLEEEPERPEFRPYPHLRLRTKPFPWGDGNKTLFHHPKYNALPDGYET